MQAKIPIKQNKSNLNGFVSKGKTRSLLPRSSCCLVLVDKVSSLLMEQSQLYIMPQVAFQFHFQSGLVNLCHSQTLITRLTHCSTRQFIITPSWLLEEYFILVTAQALAYLFHPPPAPFKRQLSIFTANLKR